MVPGYGTLVAGGGKLASSLLRNGFDQSVRDLDKAVAAPLLDNGARWANSSKAMAEGVDIVITCLPSPAVGAEGMEADDGVLAGFSRLKKVRRGKSGWK